MHFFLFPETLLPYAQRCKVMGSFSRDADAIFSDSELLLSNGIFQIPMKLFSEIGREPVYRRVGDSDEVTALGANNVRAW
jgi:hypothetical protein